MSRSEKSSASVLVIEDERDIANLYATWLSRRYETEFVTSGFEAEARLRQRRYDVILLDRRMPDLSGDDLLARIRKQAYDCRVAMVTAVSPDFDIIEMGFDSYVVKPVTSDDLFDVVNRLLTLTEYERQVQRLYRLIEKRAVLEAKKSPDQLDASEEYSTLNEEIAGLQAESQSNLATIDEADIPNLLHGLSASEIEVPTR